MDHLEALCLAGQQVLTRRDILPQVGPLRMLIVGKTPTPAGLAHGHYFEGRQGRMLWRLLQRYGLLDLPPGRYADEMLLEHGYGITNMVKRPHPFGVEPSDAEYRQGIPRVLGLIERLSPTIVLFVYKRVLDQLLRLGFGLASRAVYGFNQLDGLLGARAFVFPLPGTPCTAAQGRLCMLALREALPEPG